MIAPSAPQLFEEAACAIAETLASMPGERPIHLMLAGGPTAEGTLEALAKRGAELPIDRLHVYFGDERCVPPDHPESNAGMAQRTLLDALGVPADRIHRIRGELDPARAAREAERELRRCMRVAESGIPALDLVLLGVGEDGHTASLFPNAPELGERQRLFTSAEGPDYPRVTATYRLLRAARRIFVLAHGGELAPAVHEALDEPPSQAVPASMVCPDAGSLAWLIDEAAAARLSKPTRQRLAAP
jgi:6-phosphogluconolactonase